MVGELAVSRAGHDKGSLYLIIREEGNQVFLADGVYKTYDSPKKKNRKHIQPIHGNITPGDMEMLAANPADADTKIKRWLKTYCECK